MPKVRDIAVLVGSLRKASLNRKMAQAMAGLAPPPLSLGIVEVGDLTLYDEDLEGSPPASWTRFREREPGPKASFSSAPKYNRGIPGCLKNAIDVGSRPYGESAWAKRPAAVATVSPGDRAVRRHIPTGLLRLGGGVQAGRVTMGFEAARLGGAPQHEEKLIGLARRCIRS